MSSLMPVFHLDDHALTELARTVLARSVERWGEQRAVLLLGTSPAIVEAQHRLLQCTHTEGSALITGETGSGKELFARAIYLLSDRAGRPFVSINCAQYQDGHLLASELFGHTKGSFTGAIADRRSLFEEAHDGVIFLDEVAELPLAAQAMLLRVLGEGELVRVGENRPRKVDVRAIAATAVELEHATAQTRFREDLYYRLRCIRVRIPPLRERQDDWRLMVDYYLDRLNARSRVLKCFSNASLAVLESHPWPGNVRELRSVVEYAFYMSHQTIIEPDDFASELLTADVRPVDTERRIAAPIEPRHPTAEPGVSANAAALYHGMRRTGKSFWEAVYQPYMTRELNRREVQAVLAAGLRETHGSYKQLLPLIGVSATEYIRFMDFLRHHKLKPSQRTVRSDRPDFVSGMTRDAMA